MRQDTEGTVESIMWLLLEIFFSYQQWKNFQNPLKIDKVIAMSLVYYFSGHSVHFFDRKDCYDAESDLLATAK